MKNTGIIGCGWLGVRIAEHLSPNSKIHTTTTSEKKNSELIAMGYDSVVIQFRDDEVVQEYKPWEVSDQLDTIIITVPFSKRTDPQLLRNRFENISLFINGFSKQLFLMSSIGIYPQTGMEIAENTLEEDDLNPGILSVEQLIKNKFPQVNILRLGGLMGDDRFFSKYEISSPDQIVNHVHYEDICLITEKMISENTTARTYNIVAPLHPTKQEIINYQKDIKDHSPYIQGHGRKILSDFSAIDLNYQYLHPDPRTFK